MWIPTDSRKGEDDHCWMKANRCLSTPSDPPASFEIYGRKSWKNVVIVNLLYVHDVFMLFTNTRYSFLEKICMHSKLSLNKDYACEDSQ